MPTERVLDRLPDLDPRNRKYPIMALIEERVVRPRGWSLRTQLDQGREGACVGFAWAHELAAIPRKVAVTDEDARNIYLRAQQLDVWPGEDYEGTSVLGGAKAVLEAGHMMEYRWAFGLNEMLLALSYEGPVVLGVNWHTDMFDPDADGYIHPTGDVAGGHAIVAIAVHTASKRVVLQNSWGPYWGRSGRCYITWDELGQLLAHQGECCVPAGRR